MHKLLPKRLASLPRHPTHPSARLLRADACEVVFASYDAGTLIEPHQHDTVNCGVVTSGEMILTQADREEHYTAGDWYEIPAGRVHSSRFHVATTSIEFYFQGE